VARKSWAERERAVEGGPEFNLRRAICKADRSLPSTLEGIYDSAESDKAPSGEAEAAGKAAGAAAPSRESAGKGGWEAAHKGSSSSGHGVWKRPQRGNWGWNDNCRQPNVPPRPAKKARGSGP
ncbi:unnamed protein product, partial [Prorocentrum cordatum]